MQDFPCCAASASQQHASLSRRYKHLFPPRLELCSHRADHHAGEPSAQKQLGCFGCLQTSDMPGYIPLVLYQAAWAMCIDCRPVGQPWEHVMGLKVLYLCKAEQNLRATRHLPCLPAAQQGAAGALSALSPHAGLGARCSPCSWPAERTMRSSSICRGDEIHHSHTIGGLIGRVTQNALLPCTGHPLSTSTSQLRVRSLFEASPSCRRTPTLRGHRRADNLAVALHCNCASNRVSGEGVCKVHLLERVRQLVEGGNVQLWCVGVKLCALVCRKTAWHGD